MYHFTIKTELPKLERAQFALEKAQERYDKTLTEILNTTFETNEKQTILCKECNKRSQVKNVKYSDWYWYETPHGCIGGDTWHQGGVLIQCPKCGATEKVLEINKFTSSKDKVEYETLIKLLQHATKYEDEHIR